VNTQNFHVSCVCETAGLAKSIGLGKVGQREGFEIGERNFIHSPLINPNKVLLPLFHIQLGLMKQFVKGLNRESGCFAYLRE